MERKGTSIFGEFDIKQRVVPIELETVNKSGCSAKKHLTVFSIKEHWCNEANNRKLQQIISGSCKSVQKFSNSFSGIRNQCSFSSLPPSSNFLFQFCNYFCSIVWHLKHITSKNFKGSSFLSNKGLSLEFHSMCRKPFDKATETSAIFYCYTTHNLPYSISAFSSFSHRKVGRSDFPCHSLSLPVTIAIMAIIHGLLYRNSQNSQNEWGKFFFGGDLLTNTFISIIFRRNKTFVTRTKEASISIYTGPVRAVAIVYFTLIYVCCESVEGRKSAENVKWKEKKQKGGIINFPERSRQPNFFSLLPFIMLKNIKGNGRALMTSFCIPALTPRCASQGNIMTMIVVIMKINYSKFYEPWQSPIVSLK